ncbi:MAG: shikimate dehydrogenase [Aquabacterium sp.]
MPPNKADPPDRYAVIGWPIDHSRSPFIHAAFAQQTGQNLSYGRIACQPGELEPMLRRFIAGGPGLGPARGCNVTIPLKFDTIGLADETTARARLAQAGNVLCLEPGRWHADNTDGIGLVRDIEQGAGVAIQGARVLLIGAGGAGAGVLGPLLAHGPAALRVVNRTPQRAQALVSRHMAWAAQHGADLSAGGLDAAGAGWDIVLNASASSLQQQGVPVSSAVLRPGALALDLMYGPAALPFLDWARSHGALPRDGLGMLVQQAAEAFRIWRGVEPQTSPVLDALRHAVSAG